MNLCKLFLLYIILKTITNSSATIIDNVEIAHEANIPTTLSLQEVSRTTEETKYLEAEAASLAAQHEVQQAIEELQATYDKEYDRRKRFIQFVSIPLCNNHTLSIDELKTIRELEINLNQIGREISFDILSKGRLLEEKSVAAKQAKELSRLAWEGWQAILQL